MALREIFVVSVAVCWALAGAQRLSSYRYLAAVDGSVVGGGAPGTVEETESGSKIVRPNVTVTTSERRVFVPKGKSLKYADSPILKLSFQPSFKLTSKGMPFSDAAPATKLTNAKSSQFFRLVPSTPEVVKAGQPPAPKPTALAPQSSTAAGPPRSVHRISESTYQMPADFLCEGLTCPKGHQCTLAQPVCTAQDCSLKPSCSKKLSEHCEKCQPPCVHAVLNLGAQSGCHPCLCEVTVFRPPPNIVKRLEQLGVA